MQKRKFELANKLACRPYQIMSFLDKTTDGEPVYVALNPELPGCASHGITAEEAVESLNEARVEFIYFMLEDGLDVPEPKLFDVAQRINVNDYMDNKIDHAHQAGVPRAEFL